MTQVFRIVCILSMTMFLIQYNQIWIRIMFKVRASLRVHEVTRYRKWRRNCQVSKAYEANELVSVVMHLVISIIQAHSILLDY